MITSTYPLPLCNGQVERFNRNVLAGLRNIIEYNPKDWDMYMDALTYEYKKQMWCVQLGENNYQLHLLEFVLPRAPPPLEIAALPTDASG